jgi:hypothetical protein
MSQTIDVSGLSPQAVQVVESLIELLRHDSNGAPARQASIFDLFGKAPKLRSAADIEQQVREERDAWGEP